MCLFSFFINFLICVGFIFEWFWENLDCWSCGFDFFLEVNRLDSVVFFFDYFWVCWELGLILKVWWNSLEGLENFEMLLYFGLLFVVVFNDFV